MDKGMDGSNWAICSTYNLPDNLSNNSSDVWSNDSSNNLSNIYTYYQVSGAHRNTNIHSQQKQKEKEGQGRKGKKAFKGWKEKKYASWGYDFRWEEKYVILLLRVPDFDLTQDYTVAQFSSSTDVHVQLQIFTSSKQFIECIMDTYSLDK